MAGQRRSLILGAALWALPLLAFAGEPPNPAPPTPPGPPNRPPLLRRPGETPSPQLENIRRALEELTPEQRQQFRENFNRWLAMSPEEKRALRDVQETRRKHMAEEIDTALTRLGYPLEGPRRQAFIRRYAEERRKVEEQLRAETETKRGPLVDGIIERLKGEFANGGGPGTKNTP